ncbi:MAG: protein translocase subunit SecD, partial [Acetatifactor sp.]|nr:protein translocase subunit SecD [Acetatifactor sp.]
SPFYTEEVDTFCRKYIYQPTVDAMAAEGRPFKGAIFFGLTLTPEGTAKFEEATREAYNGGVNSKYIAIYYDGNFVSVPRVSAVISDGSAQISGSKNFEEAEKLASTIRIGGLSLELEDLHSKVVGAQLGVDAIETSLQAGAIGLVIVIVFMIAVYFISGLASSLGLGMYVALIVMLLKGFDMTLTLSGIAGIILSIGMAVDANVIIFARIREELATGKTVKSSMKIGFDKALSAIVDGNITTLIAAAVLWILGPGTVKGFAQTLALGIVLSMFTALVLTRMIMSALYTLGLKDAKWYGIGKEHKPLDILKHRNIFFGVSAALILAGFVVMGVYMGTGSDALNLSLEFKGGTATTVTFAESRNLEQINSDIVPYVEEIAGGGVQIQTVQDSNEVIFKSDSLNMEQREALNQMVMERFGVGEAEIVSETISSTISDEMTRDTILAVVVAIVCMLIY